MYRKLLLVAIVVMALSVIPSPQPASASVALLYFKATPGGSSIELEWQTATELDVVVFRVYRAQSESPGDWGTPITTQRALGDVVTGHTYQYTDGDATRGVKYDYLLREETSSGEADVKQISAGIGVPTDTPTPTVTLPPTATATWTPLPGSRILASPTATGVQPTATRRFTDGPPTAAPTTPAPRAGSTVAAPRVPTRTPLPGARVATPTGPAPRVTLPVGSMPTLIPELPTPEQLAQVEPAAPTPDAAAIEVGQVETPTPVPTKSETPVIFSSAAEETGSPTPGSAEQVAEQGNRSTALPLVLGGSAIGLAALAVAVLLFLRSRRS
jgi:hypothetical protein